ncbi:hypothetical protein A4A49_29703 [Nicotiana attenuata]|uniref:Uncharacterized protein n=1 Tax=Nicotiana attenuata TaxID=49451 RepID=A0A314L9P3_NICAT|nr:hypothetical protein A4A49_29703 [Nicotiana attenuata]
MVDLSFAISWGGISLVVLWILKLFFCFCVLQRLLKLAATAGFSLCLRKGKSEPPKYLFCVQRTRIFMELGGRLRFVKGGYSLSLKFNLANEFSYTFSYKEKV